MSSKPIELTVKCKNCGRDVVPTINPKGKGPDKCPECNAFIPTKKRGIKGGFGPDDKGAFRFNMGAGTSLNAKEMQMIEDLVGVGVGENPKDLLRKGLYALAASYKLGGDTMMYPTKQKEQDEYYKEWLRKHYPNSAEERIKSIFKQIIHKRFYPYFIN